MPGSTKATIAQSVEAESGIYEISFEVDNQPGEPESFTRHFREDSNELRLLQEHSDISSPEELAHASSEYPVEYKGEWKIEYGLL
jgi:hypothetical protein